MEILLWIIGIALVIVGIAGIVVPALPGILLVFLGLVSAAWADGFERVGWITLALIGGMGLLSMGVDLLATVFGVKKMGASKWALLGAALGAAVGLFFGFLGILLGPFVGAFVVELLVQRDPKQAGKAGFGTWLGYVIGTAVKFSLAFGMIGIFLLAYFW